MGFWRGVPVHELFRHFRPTFPWSIVRNEPERWNVIQHVKSLALQDVYEGEPLSKRAVQELRDLTHHNDWLIRFGAKTALHFAGHDMSGDSEFYKWLTRYLELKRPKRVPVQTFDVSREAVLARFPFLSTPAKEHLVARLREAVRISKSLNRPVLLFGGVVKGTSLPGGDLDYAVVSREPLHVDARHQAVPVITPESRDPVSLSILFLGHGIFTGSPRLVRDVQRAVLRDVSEMEWESARKNTAKNEAQIHHVVSIFGVPPEKVPLVAALRVLYATPPRLGVVRRILRVP